MFTMGRYKEEIQLSGYTVRDPLASIDSATERQSVS